MAHYYNRPGLLLQPLRFKTVGKEEYTEFKAGRPVKVSRHAQDPGTFVVFGAPKKYAVVKGEELHLYVNFGDNP